MAIKIINPWFVDTVQKQQKIEDAGNALKSFLQTTGSIKEVWTGAELVQAIAEIQNLPDYEEGTIDAVCQVAGVKLKR